MHSIILLNKRAFDRTMRFYIILSMFLCLDGWKALAKTNAVFGGKKVKFWCHKRWTVCICKIISEIDVHIERLQLWLMQWSFHYFDFTIRMLEWCGNIDCIYTFTKSKYQHWVISYRFSLISPNLCRLWNFFFFNNNIKSLECMFI